MPETPDSRVQASDNGPEAGLQDLLGRLTRLGGLRLELTSQLLPVLPQFLSPPRSPETVSRPEVHGLADEVDTRKFRQPQSGLAAPQSWWSRLWSFWSY